MKFILSAATSLFCYAVIFAQSLPSQWTKHSDSHIMSAGENTSEGLYDESTLEEIRLYFPQSNYWSLLTTNYNTKTDIPCNLKYKNTQLDSVGIRFKGQTSYFMNQSQKKSFNISTDAFKDDQKLAGYKTLNLNNAWQDPSFMREVLYYHLIRPYTPSAKANFVRLYINDQDWGVYLNVQQLNKDFLEEWHENNDGINMRADVPDGSSTGPGGMGGPQWGDGTAALNYLGEDTTKYQKYYTLKSSDVSTTVWQELKDACAILNNSGSDLVNVAPTAFDIDKILWHLAVENVFVDDDSYIYKGKMDYYLYKDAVTGRWSTYDYDANSTFGADRVTWSPFYNANKVNYPLLNKILAIPTFRQRYLAHIRTLVTDVLDETKVNAIIDQYNTLIQSAVFADTKKVTTNAAYTAEITVLKNFIKNRKTSLLSNAEVKAASPTIANAPYTVDGEEWANVTSENEVVITSQVSFNAGLSSVVLHYGIGFSGVFTSLPMYDDGSHGDLNANDGIYSVTLPGFSTGSLVKYYIEAIGADTAGSTTYFPSGAEHKFLYFDVAPKVLSEKTVVINEFMASNNGSVLDEAGDAEDWIELYNTTDNVIDMSGYFISDNPANLAKFQLPAGTVIAPNGYLIIWADEEQEKGPLHVNFKLSAGGEYIFLLDASSNILDSIAFGAQTTDKTSARIPNGTGPFVIGNHTFNANNEGTSYTVDTYEQTFVIRPNPAHSTIYVSNPNESLQVMDLNGRVVMNIAATEGDYVDISQLPEAMYIIRGKSVAQKLVIVK